MGTQNRRSNSVGYITSIEKQREIIQCQIDSSKDIEERRALGQFATPYDLAKEIISYGVSLLEDDEIDFLEPSFGTGAFFSALQSIKSIKRIKSITGYEIDSEIYQKSVSLWKGNYYNLICGDFLCSQDDKQFNLIISNPPYVRHHLIDKTQKAYLVRKIKKETNISISGLAGLYCYFLLSAHKQLKPGAISGWLIPSEFMDVNYGKAVKDYLLNSVHLLRIHRYTPENSKFKDALVSSCVVWFRNEIIHSDYEIELSYGGTHDTPEVSKIVTKKQLIKKDKWTNITAESVSTNNIGAPTLGDFFTIKRGLATGDNGFFILSKEQITELGLDMSFFTPILPSPHKLKENEIFKDTSGYPLLETQYFLLDCTLSEEDLKANHPEVWAYLEGGKETTGRKYLCRNRKKWYFQERRSATPFLCSYMGRSKSEFDNPFRFILNHTNAVATNSYMMLYPKEDVLSFLSRNPESLFEIWKALRSISRYDLESQGRVYGGGLKKIEPRELSKVRCEKLSELIVKGGAI